MYQSYFNFTGKPFRLSPDPGFFFPSRGHKRALAYLRYGLKQDEGFVVITGAPGTGKTTLAKILLNEMGDTNIVVAHLTTTQLDAEDTLRMVASSFEIKYEGLDKPGLINALETFLQARSQERKRALLVIDESQNLPVASLEELRMLANLQAGDKSLLQIFLLAQEQFRNVLDQPDLEQLRQRVIANYHLIPLATDETQRYVESRLSQVGWTGNPGFAEIAYEKIHTYTEGVPRKINLLCDRILLFCCMEERHEVTGEIVGNVIDEIEQEASGSPIDRLKTNDQSQLAAELKKQLDEDATMELTQEMRTETLELPIDEFDLDLGLDEEAARIENADTLMKKASSSATFENADTLMKRAPRDGDSLPPLVSSLPLDSSAPPVKASNRRKTQQAAVANTASVSHDDFDEPTTLALGTTNKGVIKKKEKKKSRFPKKPATKQSSPVKSNLSTAAEVLGNTIAKRKIIPQKKTTPPPLPVAHTEYPDRDLFRVISGGKQEADQQILPPISANNGAEPSAEEVVLRRILRLVLAFHRSPSRFPGLDSPTQPLPEGITELLELAVADDEVLTQVSPAAVMGISPVMLRAAVRFFVRRALFIENADDYRVLGLQAGADHGVIEIHYDLLMRLLRQDKQRGSADFVARIGEAYETLSQVDVSATAALPQYHDELPPSISPNEQVIIGDGDMTISFDDVKQPPITTPPEAEFSSQPEEMFTYEEDGATHKRMRYAGQLAVLGFGALVIILGMYIVQLEPDNEGKTATSRDSNKLLAQAEEIQLEEKELNDTQASTRSDIQELLKKMESARLRNESTTNSGASSSKNEDSAVFADLTQTNPTQESRPDSRSSQKNNSSSSQKKNAQSVLFDMQERIAKRESQDTKSLQPVDDQFDEPSIIAGRNTVNIQSRPTTGRSFLAPRNNNRSKTVTAKPLGSGTSINAPVRERQAFSTKPTQSMDINTPLQVTSIGTPNLSRQVQINERDLTGLLRQFSQAYSGGNINDLMGLFTLNAKTNNQKSAVGIRTDYLDLFRSTAFREMKFSGIRWEKDGVTARGFGNYAARITTNDSSGSQSFGGKVTLRVEKLNQTLKLTQFYFTNTAPKVASAPAIPKITQTQADTTINNFVKYYESGDINALMALFAKGARTNDQTTLAGIRKDHVDLFANTNARQMFIKNLAWKFETGGASGSGAFEVLVKAKGSAEFVSYKGKITIKMRQLDGQLKLTYLLHNTQ